MPAPLRRIEPSRLAARREELGLERAELAARAGVTERMTFFYEEGRHSPTPARPAAGDPGEIVVAAVDELGLGGVEEDLPGTEVAFFQYDAEVVVDGGESGAGSAAPRSSCSVSASSTSTRGHDLAPGHDSGDRRMLKAEGWLWTFSVAVRPRRDAGGLNPAGNPNRVGAGEKPL